eukprot:g19283.t1
MVRNCNAPCHVGGPPEVPSDSPDSAQTTRRVRVVATLAFLLICVCALEVKLCEMSESLGFSSDTFTATLEAMEVMAVFGIASAAGKLAHGSSLLFPYVNAFSYTLITSGQPKGGSKGVTKPTCKDFTHSQLLSNCFQLCQRHSRSAEERVSRLDPTNTTTGSSSGEPRKSTGSWTTIFADGPKDKLSSARESELSTVQKGVKSPKSSSDSTEYDAFATGPEPALKSPRERTEQSEESLARPSGLHAIHSADFVVKDIPVLCAQGSCKELCRRFRA